MNDPDWREVTVSPDVVEKLGHALADLGFEVSDFEILSDILEPMKEIFRESWDELHETPDGSRSYRFPTMSCPM